ncbi:MAG: hypothetical protein DRP87_02985 [Spirochaetes bacterium]|nr:MAG: hypothetical protein DRP87_02985 [Spirochaetota bacterium]
MFFFIGGVQPKTITLDERLRTCPRCGFTEAQIKRVDEYISIFFIPLFPVGRGEPILVCNRCGFSEPLRRYSSERIKRKPERVAPNHCPDCGNPISPNFYYCPYCGQRL